MTTADSRLGALDRQAVNLYKQILALIDSPEWEDDVENMILDTKHTVDWAIANPQEFDDEMDQTKIKILTRVAKAFINSGEGVEDRVATIAYRERLERAVQT